jgi:hypothetical protein
MDDKLFKKENRMAACTENPIEKLIPANIRRETILKIKNESIDVYGYDVMGECPKRKVCMKKQCIGRPLAWKSETAKPYLETLAKASNIVSDELFIVTDCSTCPIVKSCDSLCNQVTDFINRDQSKEPNISYRNLTENLLPDDQYIEEPEIFNNNLEIPWDILTEQKKDIIKKYVYEQRDFGAVAKAMGILNQARAKYFLYAALTRLSEYAIMRQFISDNRDRLTDTQYNVLYNVYFANKKLIEVASDSGVTKQAVSKLINQIIEKNRIKWYVFVRKEGNKVVYNVPNILK